MLQKLCHNYYYHYKNKNAANKDKTQCANYIFHTLLFFVCIESDKNKAYRRVMKQSEARKTQC